MSGRRMPHAYSIRRRCWLPLYLALAGCAAQVPASTTQGNISSTAAKQEFAVERALGAVCPSAGEDQSGYHPTSSLPHGICRGRMPAHMAHMLAQMPPAELQLSAEDHRRLPSDEVTLRAVPGLGQRADFWVNARDGWIRSFEGPDPETTVYLMQGSFCSRDDRTGPHPCPIGMRAYRTYRNGPPSDVTAEVLPPEPVLSAADRAFYYDEYRGPSDPFLLTQKLYYAPTMRWVMEFDSHDTLPANAPNRLNSNMVHLGFVRWTGARFELRQTIPHSQWPCYPVPQGEAACSREEAQPDPYLTSDS